MCDLLCDIVSFCIWSCDTGKIKVCDKIVIENEKEIYVKNQRIFHINLHLKDGLGMELTAC